MHSVQLSINFPSRSGWRPFVERSILYMCSWSFQMVDHFILSFIFTRSLPWGSVPIEGPWITRELEADNHNSKDMDKNTELLYLSWIFQEWVWTRWLFYYLVQWNIRGSGSHQPIEGTDKLINAVIWLELMLSSLSPTEQIQLSGHVHHTSPVASQAKQFQHRNI